MQPAGRAFAAWAARRALMEGATVTAERLATACGLQVRTLRDRAAREGWNISGSGVDADLTSSAAPRLTRTQRIARVHDRLLDKVEREQLRTEVDSGPLDKAGIAELAATARILAKIGEITRDEDGAREKQLERDADIATILDRLDRQIVELARHLAHELAQDLTTTMAGEADAPRIAAGQP